MTQWIDRFSHAAVKPYILSENQSMQARCAECGLRMLDHGVALSCATPVVVCPGDMILIRGHLLYVLKEEPIEDR